MKVNCRLIYIILFQEMDIKELKERQSWSLDQKIDHALGAIDQFYQRLAVNGLYLPDEKPSESI